MATYLIHISERVIEMRRVLKETGNSIYIHIDPTASHYIKIVMDCVFGVQNFRNEIVWGYAPTGKPPNDGFPKKHDVILFYSQKKGSNKWEQPYTEMKDATKKTYNKVDKDGRSYKIGHKGLKAYLDDSDGRPVPSWWADIKQFRNRISSERIGGIPNAKAARIAVSHNKRIV